MTVNVIKWSYIYGAPHAELFPSIGDAVEAAKVDSDNGTESLHCIEVIDGGTSRIIDKDEVWRLTKPLEEAEKAEWANQPKPTASTFILGPDGKEARWGNYPTMDQATAAAQLLTAIVGPDRVRVAPFPR